jgi:serine/threonine protein kinase
VTKAAPAPRVARFESFEVDLRTGELRNNGEKVKLPEQSFQILAMLLGRPGEVVMRQEIQKRLWPNDTVVEFENSINAAVKNLRLALGDSADQPRYIETLARRGYRWLVSVNWTDENSLNPPQAALHREEVAAPAAYLLGKKVSHYRVLEILGGGGMGVVYKAEDLKLGRRVALKFLPEEMANDPAAMERFKREARAASALNHPNICTIYSVEEHNGQPFIAMELLEGHTLRELIGLTEGATATAQTEALPIGRLLEIAIQICEGLNAAHQKGIIHRDIKPANVFITSQGRAKILDFGLAKSQEFEGSDLGPSLAAEAHPVANFNLTRSGTTIGTAGYMSPEQVRGEKVDTRTDLFSFGLVLYEMAVGQRAFRGDTIPELHAALLNDAPVPVRQVNPGISAELETIINKALEKEREKRYQTASDMRASLTAAAGKLSGRTRRASSSLVRWLIAAAALLALLMTVGAISTVKRRSSGLPPIQLSTLTQNSADNAVGDGSISPDGKYFVYLDKQGMHLKSLATDEVRDLPQPGPPKDKPINWGLGGWFPDSQRFLVNATQSGATPGVVPGVGSSLDTSIWIFSVLGSEPRRIRDSAMAQGVSPDGSAIAFGTNPGRFGDREIWLMEPDGQNARKLYDTDENSSIAAGSGSVLWSHNGKYIAYWRLDAEGASFLTRDLQGGRPTTIFPPSLGNNIYDLTWAPGRWIYSSSLEWCTFYEQAMDEETGKAIGQPRPLTSRSSSYCMGGLSTTADGKAMAFLKWQSDFSVYVGDLDAGGTHVLRSRHFTLTRFHDDAGDFTPGGKALILISVRSSYHGLYRQPLEKDNAVYLPDTQDVRNPQVTPDGKWVLYFEHHEHPAWDVSYIPERLMRAAIDSGSPHAVLTATGAKSQISCARPPSDLCVIAEWSDDRKEVIVHAVDAINGRGPELTRFAVDPHDERWTVALSPDGKRFAGIRRPQDPIYVWSANGEKMREIQVKGWGNLGMVRWSADSKRLLVLSYQKGYGTLLHTDLQGNAQVLWDHVTENWAESPDGRHLAVTQLSNDQNYMLMTDF